MGSKTFFKPSCRYELRETHLPLGQKICSLLHARSTCSELAGQQENLSIKGMGFAAQRDSLQGFPL